MSDTESCHVKGQGLSKRRGGCTQPWSLLCLPAHDKRNTDESRTLWEWQGAWTVRWTGPAMFWPEPKGNEGEVSQSIFLLASGRTNERGKGSSLSELTWKQSHLPKRTAAQPCCLAGCDLWPLPWRRYGEGSGSLIAGPSLSLLGHPLALQHHIGDEQSWNAE